MLFNEQLAAALTDDGPKLPWKTPVVRELEGMDAKKARFLAALEDWTTAAKASRDEDAAARKALKGNDRLHAHRRAELEGLARYYREHPRADVAPGLFSLIVLLSDNDEYGACYLSISRMAEVLSRTPDSIRDALRRLAAAGIIGTEERRGDSTLCWPLLHTSFGDKPSLHWLVEHYSPRREIGRPCKNPLPVEGEPISGKPPGVNREGVSENPSPSNPKTPPPPPRDDFSLDLAKKKERDASAPCHSGACDLYNTAAEAHGWTVCRSLTSPRAKRLVGRLRDIGGLEAFKRALSAIPRNDFLMGRLPPRPGEKSAFRLDLAYLLQTDGKSGDVLAKLIDAAGDAAPGPQSGSHLLPPNWWQTNPMAPRQFPRDAWRQLIKAQPPGVWSREICGPPPGSNGCVVPSEIIHEFRLTELYTPEGIAR